MSRMSTVWRVGGVVYRVKWRTDCGIMREGWGKKTCKCCYQGRGGEKDHDYILVLEDATRMREQSDR